MINHIILVGRITQTPELQITENGKKISEITLAVPRPYKNQSGEYDTDFLDCTLWTTIAETTAEYCQVGDLIGVKGRLQSRMIEREDGTKYKRTEVIAERVTFLTSKNSKTTVESNEEEIELSEQESSKNTKKQSSKNTKRQTNI